MNVILANFRYSFKACLWASLKCRNVCAWLARRAHMRLSSLLPPSRQARDFNCQNKRNWSQCSTWHTRTCRTEMTTSSQQHIPAAICQGFSRSSWIGISGTQTGRRCSLHSQTLTTPGLHNSENSVSVSPFLHLLLAICALKRAFARLDPDASERRKHGRECSLQFIERKNAIIVFGLLSYTRCFELSLLRLKVIAPIQS